MFLSRTSDYSFSLPDELIARYPLEKRDNSRLLVIDRKKKVLSHHLFSELPELLEEGDLLVANNSKVMKARLFGYRILNGERGGKVECLLLNEKEKGTWECMMKSSAKIRPGFLFQIEKDKKTIDAEVISLRDPHTGTLEVRWSESPLGWGELPLPPYMNRRTEDSDEDRYQTVYAKKIGSAAAPTAGLHFTHELHQKLRQKKINWEEVTLHVGVGTFKPVQVDSIKDHVMHSERYFLSQKTADSILESKKQNKKIIAVGTTSVRTLESSFEKNKTLCADEGDTDIFIYPGGHEFRVVDGLITNFHLPESTLLMLVSAFAGYDLIMSAYQEAIKQRYRFYSYGDAMLIL